jgi:PIN domain nuclease of toxin-antitoxin system
VNLLLDTQALLWFLEDAATLSIAAREQIEDEANTCFVSMATGWEMAIKITLGKLRPPIPLQYLFTEELERLHFTVLSIEARHLHQLPELPLHHRDPFDRIIVSQALSEGFAVVGNDQAFDAYGIRRIW